MFSFFGDLELRHPFVRNALMVSGLCNLQLQEFSFINMQTLHNDCSYIEHVPLLFCANLINIFLFLGLLKLYILSIRNA